MGTKLNPGAFDCHANALPDEPLFVLLARDPDMPRLVRLWAARRESDCIRGVRPMTDMAMVDEAYQCATDAEAWRAKNDGAWRK